VMRAAKPDGSAEGKTISGHIRRLWRESVGFGDYYDGSYNCPICKRYVGNSTRVRTTYTGEHVKTYFHAPDENAEQHTPTCLWRSLIAYLSEHDPLPQEPEIPPIMGDSELAAWARTVD
jgi:hypothetical protein